MTLKKWSSTERKWKKKTPTKQLINIAHHLKLINCLIDTWTQDINQSPFSYQFNKKKNNLKTKEFIKTVF